jgi:hypothetical protein
MPSQDSEKKGLKQKVKHEFEELVILTGYLAFFFCALATYSMLLLDRFHISYFAYGTALINALIIAKVILIGEAAHAGRHFEAKALVYSALWKAFVFAWLVFAFHLAEEMIRDVMHGANVGAALHDIRIYDLLIRSGLIFCLFIPLFLFRELKRVVGDEDFRVLLFHQRSAPNAGPASSR